VTAGAAVVGTFVALNNQPPNGFAGMSIAGRALLWGSGAGFITLVVMMSASDTAENVLRIGGWTAGALLLLGLILYVFGQRSDGSDKWHRQLEEEQRQKRLLDEMNEPR